MKNEESQKVTLNEREQIFVDAYASPPWPTIEKAAKLANYSHEYARRLKHKPHIVDAICAKVEEHRRARQRDTERLVDKLLERAFDNTDPKMAKENADLYLEAAGVIGRGTKIGISVNTSQHSAEQADDAFVERARAAARARGVVDFTPSEN